MMSNHSISLAIAILYHFCAQVKYCVDVAGPMLRGFGYDPITQQFPTGATAIQLPPEERCLRNNNKVDVCSEQCRSFTVNAGKAMRDVNDVFGRGLTEIRKRHTDGDKTPLPLAVT
jgi:hypothetical protein